MINPRNNGRYTKLGSIIECMKHSLFKQLKMPTVSKRDERILHKGIISEMSISSRLCFKNFCTICTCKKRKINILKNSGMVTEQHNRDFSIQTFSAIRIAGYFSVSLINNWKLSMGQIFLSWNLCYFLCDILKGLIKTNNLHEELLI